MTTGPGDVGRLLAVHAHPDDETLSTGALLATWAASGAPVTVVTCTRGERGEVIPPDLAHLEADGPALAAHREVELARALAVLGVTEHAFLDELPGGGERDGRGARADRYEDSGMTWVGPGRAGPAADSGPAAFARADVDEAAARLATLVRERRPDVVVGYEPGGGYGHPDHVQAHRVMTRAVALAREVLPGAAAVRGAPYEVPLVLWAVVDAAAWRRAEEAVAGDVGRDGLPAGLRLPGPDRAAPSAAVPADEVDVRVDVRPVLPAVLGALRAHASQVQAVQARPAGAERAVARLALSDGVLRPVPVHEAYRAVAGRPHDVRLPSGVALA